MQCRQDNLILRLELSDANRSQMMRRTPVTKIKKFHAASALKTRPLRLAPQIGGRCALSLSLGDAIFLCPPGEMGFDGQALIHFIRSASAPSVELIAISENLGVAPDSAPRR